MSRLFEGNVNFAMELLAKQALTKKKKKKQAQTSPTSTIYFPTGPVPASLALVSDSSNDIPPQLAATLLWTALRCNLHKFIYAVPRGDICRYNTVGRAMLELL